MRICRGFLEGRIFARITSRLPLKESLTFPELGSRMNAESSDPPLKSYELQKLETGIRTGNPRTRRTSAQNLCGADRRFLDFLSNSFSACGERETVVSGLAACLDLRRYCSRRNHLSFVPLQKGV